MPKVAEIVDLEANPDPVAGLDEAEGSVIAVLPKNLIC